MEDEQIQLITEQLGRLSDKISARLAAVEIELDHYGEKLSDTRKTVDDHENRLRSVTDQGTRNTVILGLFSGGSLMTSIAAFIKAFVSGP
jgi:hypothetical protein